jgi:hypothetical protein
VAENEILHLAPPSKTASKQALYTTIKNLFQSVAVGIVMVLYPDYNRRPNSLLISSECNKQ